MLSRRGLAAATSASGSTSRSATVHHVVAQPCTCRSSRQTFTTSAPVRRNVPSGRSSSYSAPRPSFGRYDSGYKKPYAKPYQRATFDFQGFAAPKPPTGQAVARKLAEQTQAMFETGLSMQGSEKRDPDGLGARLVAYGLKGRAAEMLLYANSENKEILSSYETAADARALFQIWAEAFLRELPQRALEYDARHNSASVQPSTPPLPDTDTEQPSTKPLFGPIEDVIKSYATEGESCLSRYITSAFLDWIEAGLAELVSPTAPFRAVSSSDKLEVDLVASQLSSLRRTMDLRRPAHAYPLARSLTRQVHLHVGPTNSGKTHGALVALSKARTGVFAGPLRLLAHEVWDRFNSGTISPGIPPRACNLITGEEVRVSKDAGLESCTVEMVNYQKWVEVGVVDEIQMIGDPLRGFAWTDAVLGLPAKELHLCGEASTIPLIERMIADCGDVLHVHDYQRLTPLTIAQESLNNDLRRIKAGDCIVAFSRTGIFALKREIEQTTGLRCAVAYGALPPETKAEQAKLFNAGKLDVMVASDAIGMGLNLKIKRVVFESVAKYNGKEMVALSASQIKQIAGRAGRYGAKRETEKADGGTVTTRHPEDLDILRQALESPLLPIDRAAIKPSRDTMAALATMIPPSRAPFSDVAQPDDVAQGPTQWSKQREKKAIKAAVKNREHDARIEQKRILREMQGPGFRTLTEMYKDVSLLSRIQPSTYFMSDFSQQLVIAPLVEAASSNNLTIPERENFSNAPANTRDERALKFLQQAVRLFSLGGLVPYDACAQGSGMLEIETLMLQIMRRATELRAQRYPNPDQHTPSEEEVPLASFVGQNHELFSLDSLMLLESLHRSMSMYLWLSFRFPLAFCYRSEVNQRKVAMEGGIEFVLEGIRYGRAQRRQVLGRTNETNAAFGKPTWPQARESRPDLSTSSRLSA